MIALQGCHDWIAELWGQFTGSEQSPDLQKKDDGGLYAVACPSKSRQDARRCRDGLLRSSVYYEVVSGTEAAKNRACYRAANDSQAAWAVLAAGS